MSGSVRLSAPCTCPAGTWLELRAESAAKLAALPRCPSCSSERPIRTDRLTEEGGLVGCLACGHPELFTRKRFPRAFGISVVVAAALLAPSTHYLSLVVAAAIDFLLFHAIRDVVVCYVCRAEHRGFAREPRHPRFDREIAERLRFGTRAVMGKPMREGGTAGAPDPEH